ncbi:MAG: hypothetical protein Q7T54_02440 [Candidatus Levybacteria bacterium]|nr:hypothetical protein [Candidatus Levybacteria bacterium]
MSQKLFLALWVIASIFLFLYSFTQVDLSLTLSTASIFQTVEKGFQYIGWFNRPLSTYLYISIFALLFMLYFWTLQKVSKNLITSKVLWTAIILVTVILMMSYNAFSRDIFNYIFDARIVSFYHENPYVHKALDFPGDPMLSFMHWTHRTYPYGPMWLVLTVPLTFIGNHIFIFTFYLFKLLMASFFLLTVWSIGKIAVTLKMKNVLLPVAAFALNPFVLTESLVSAHNDIVMMGFAMLGTYYLLRKEKIKGSIIYAFSIGIKFATALLIIGFFILHSFGKTRYFIGVAVLLMTIGVILATMRTNFQPWYLLYVFPFAVLMSEKKYIRFPLFIFSIANIIYYIPYLNQGTWDPPIPALLNNIMISAIILSVISVLVFFPGWGKRKK